MVYKKGHKLDKEILEKRIATRLKNSKDRGYYHSKETIKKIIDKQKGVKSPNRSRSKLAEKNPMWKGGIDSSYYLKRVEKKNCESCGNKERLEVHHIDGNHKNNNPENWKVLCRRCHMIEDGRLQKAIERGKKMFEQGILIPNWSKQK